VNAAEQRLSAAIRDIEDFPRSGISFKDITPLLADAALLAEAVEGLVRPHHGSGVTKVLGVEARGFILASPVALALGAGFIPVRKVGKLPWEVERAEYELEYGTDVLEVHRDAVRPGERILIVDDVLATGGTAAAAVRLATVLGAEVVGLSFLIELTFLEGRAALGGWPVHSLLSF